MTEELSYMNPEITPYLKLKLTQMTVSGQGLNKTEEWEYDPTNRLFTISSGATNVRFGANKARKTLLSADEWEGLLQSRLRHRWVVLSTEKAEIKEYTKNVGFKEIASEAVANIIEILHAAADEFYDQSFSVKVEDIPQKDLDKANDIIADLSKKNRSVASFNQKLLELWTIIPRPMNKMKKFIASSEKDFDKILVRETETLQFLEDQIRLANDSANIDERKTILEANNLELTEASEDEIAYVKSLMTDKADRISRVFRAKNHTTEATFDAFCRENSCTEANGGIQHLFHGSNVSNWWSIFLNGLYLDPAKIKADVQICGKVFGYGIYFAPYAGKSLGYSGGGWRPSDASKQYLAVFKVATGKPYDIYKEGGKVPRHWTDFHEDHPDRLCCWATRGTSSVDNPDLWRLNYDEVIVYQQEQCTIEYLIEMECQ